MLLHASSSIIARWVCQLHPFSCGATCTEQQLLPVQASAAKMAMSAQLPISVGLSTQVSSPHNIPRLFLNTSIFRACCLVRTLCYVDMCWAGLCMLYLQ